jgi:hypothetical protein
MDRVLATSKGQQPGKKPFVIRVAYISSIRRDAGRRSDVMVVTDLLLQRGGRHRAHERYAPRVKKRVPTPGAHSPSFDSCSLILKRCHPESIDCVDASQDTD